MNKKRFIIIATAAFALHAGVMAWMIIQREITLSQGERFSFKVVPVDPHDVFRGKYVQLHIVGGGPFTNRLEFKRGQRLYAPLTKDAAGIASMTELLVKPPQADPYIRVKCSWCNEQKVKSGGVTTNFMYYSQQKIGGAWRWRSASDVAKYNFAYTKVQTNTVDKYQYTGKYITTIKVPFDRYYMDEKLAPKAEQAYLDNFDHGNQDAILNVRVRNGNALIESLEINGQSIRDLAIEEE